MRVSDKTVFGLFETYNVDAAISALKGRGFAEEDISLQRAGVVVSVQAENADMALQARSILEATGSSTVAVTDNRAPRVRTEFDHQTPPPPRKFYKPNWPLHLFPPSLT